MIEFIFLDLFGDIRIVREQSKWDVVRDFQFRARNDPAVCELLFILEIIILFSIVLTTQPFHLLKGFLVKSKLVKAQQTHYIAITCFVIDVLNIRNLKLHHHSPIKVFSQDSRACNSLVFSLLHLIQLLLVWENNTKSVLSTLKAFVSHKGPCWLDIVLFFSSSVFWSNWSIYVRVVQDLN